MIDRNSCEPARAVDPRRLVERAVDLAHPGQQQDRAEAEQDPDADDPDGRQRGVEVAEPGAGDVAEADRGQDLVDEAVRATAAGPR